MQPSWFIFLSPVPPVSLIKMSSTPPSCKVHVELFVRDVLVGADLGKYTLISYLDWGARPLGGDLSKSKSATVILGESISLDSKG